MTYSRCWKEKNLEHRILYPAKLFYKSKVKINFLKPKKDWDNSLITDLLYEKS